MFPIDAIDNVEICCRDTVCLRGGRELIVVQKKSFKEKKRAKSKRADETKEQRKKRCEARNEKDRAKATS